jgi:archaea-specific DNA-binding protein
MTREVTKKSEVIAKESSSKKLETNEIFVGNKPFMKYVIATMMQLQEDKNKSAVIKARGKFISRAVDIAEVAKKRMKENQKFDLKDQVIIGTDNFKSPEGKDINISTIDIILSK